MKFMWGLLTGAFLGAIVTMWYINRQLADTTNTTNTATTTQPTTLDNGLPADFEAFLQHFSTDSIFQMGRISFPLAGLPAYADSTTMVEKKFRYLPEEWVMHKPFNTESGFKQSFEVAGEYLVIENSINKEAGFGMQRRFAKLNDEWNLIFFAGINKLNGE